jgi:hypothetical protein
MSGQGPQTAMASICEAMAAGMQVADRTSGIVQQR